MPRSGTVAVLTTSGITVLARITTLPWRPPVHFEHRQCRQRDTAGRAGRTHQHLRKSDEPREYGHQPDSAAYRARRFLPQRQRNTRASAFRFEPADQCAVAIQRQRQRNTYHTHSWRHQRQLSLHREPAAPSVFQSGAAGPETGLATIVRASNSQLVTATNPIHTNDTLIIFLTGMGQTTPQVPSGMPSPSNPLALANITPNRNARRHRRCGVSYAGLVPGEVGVYQINATVPTGVPQGLSIPLNINQGAANTTLNVRVVN